MWLKVGEQFLVVDMFELGFTRPGRAPTARERAEARPPYQDPRTARKQWGEPAPIDENELDDQAAITAAYAEQRREPVDLLQAVAA